MKINAEPKCMVVMEYHKQRGMNAKYLELIGCQLTPLHASCLSSNNKNILEETIKSYMTVFIEKITPPLTMASWNTLLYQNPENMGFLFTSGPECRNRSDRNLCTRQSGCTCDNYLPCHTHINELHLRIDLFEVSGLEYLEVVHSAAAVLLVSFAVDHLCPRVDYLQRQQNVSHPGFQTGCGAPFS